MMGKLKFLRGGIELVPPRCFVTDSLGTFEVDYTETMRLHNEEGWYTYSHMRIVNDIPHHYFRFE